MESEFNSNLLSIVFLYQVTFQNNFEGIFSDVIAKVDSERRSDV